MSTELTLVLHDDGLASGNDDIGSVVDGLEVDLELDTGEVGDEAVLADRKGARRVVVVENCAELEHLDILGTGVRDGSGDLDVVDRVNLTWCCEVQALVTHWCACRREKEGSPVTDTSRAGARLAGVASESAADTARVMKANENMTSQQLETEGATTATREPAVCL